MKRRRIFFAAAVLMSVSLFAALTFVFISLLSNTDTGTDVAIVQGLREEVVLNSDEVTVRTPEADGNLTRQIDFDELEVINSDVLSWIYMPDTNVDYYVMQEPSGMPDGEYMYIWRDIYQEENSWGSIFTPYIPGGQGADAHMILFGHRMRDRTLGFSNLREFLDETYMQEHPYVYLYYPEYSQRWKVWAACNPEFTDDIYRIAPRYELGSAEYGELLLHIEEDLAETLSGERPDVDTPILVLSTCYQDDIRMCVICYLDKTYEY